MKTLHFFLGEQALPNVSEVRDLGVLVDASLSFSPHCLSVAKAGKRAAFQTLRCFQSGRVAPLVNAYTTYVRPKLEYATQIFYPQRKRDSNAIESVQKFYTRILYRKCGRKYASYEKRLKFLKLDTLAVRRTKLDLMLAYKMFRGLTSDCDVLSRSTSIRSQRITHKLIKDKPGCLPRILFFSNRVVEMWNKVPDDIALGELPAFKRYVGL